MGQIRTIIELLKGVSKFGGPKSLIAQTIPAVLEVPSREFGRFNKLSVGKLDDAFGLYRPVQRDIHLNAYGAGPKTFFHELTHARQHNPDPDERERALMLLLSSVRPEYEFHPIEKVAHAVSEQARMSPRRFGNFYREETFKPSYDYFRREAEDVFKDWVTNPRSFDPTQTIRMKQAIEHTKQYSGKGWLYSSLPIWNTALDHLHALSSQTELEGEKT